MATPADQRLLELLDKWLKSLELHLRYSSLDDDTYMQIQPWPEHQRPSRWIIDLAKQKALALQGQIQERVRQSDAKFSDSLELMTFLANLLGAEHIERFIPLADADAERADSKRGAEASAAADAPPVDSSTMTREMPKFPAGKQRAPAPASTDQLVRTERKAGDAVTKTAPKTAARGTAGAAGGRPTTTAKPAATPASPSNPPGRTSASDRPASPEAVREQVIADAARLVQWGRKWYELAELISSMADRPSLTDVRRILNDNKTAIDKKAGRG